MGNVVDAPGATMKHIFRINNTRAYLQANLANNQMAFETDFGLIGFKGNDGVYHNAVAMVDGVTKVTDHFGFFEDVDGTLGIKSTSDGGATWTDTGVRLY